MRFFRFRLAFVGFVLLAPQLPAQAPAKDDDAALRRAGDIVHIALPAIAGGAAALQKDWGGLRQFAFSFGATVGTVEILKQTFNKNRPDLENNRSFPSGHTAFSFSGASFIWRRYGARFGIPAVAAAGFVGFTRIKGKKHFGDDVVAGAGIALIYNWLLVKPPDGKVRIKPSTLAGGGYGLTMEIDTARDGAAQRSAPDLERERPFRISFEFGVMDSRRLYMSAPPGAGTFLSVAPYERAVTPTARFEGSWRFRGPHEFVFVLAPFEARDFGGFPEQEFRFGDTVFAAGTQTEGRFRFNELLFRYRYRLVNTRRFDFRAGGGLAVRETLGAVAQEATNSFAQAAATEVTPLAHVRVQVTFTRHIGALAEIDGVYRSGKQWSAGGMAGLRLSTGEKWDFLFGYRLLTRKHEADKLFNHITFDYFGFGVGYAF